MVLLPEMRVRLLAELTAGHDERTKALTGHVRALLLEPVVALHDLRHHDVRALLEESDLARLRVADDDAHSLRLGREREDVEHFEVDPRAGGGLQLDPSPVAERQAEAYGLGPLHDSDFVW